MPRKRKIITEEEVPETPEIPVEQPIQTPEEAELSGFLSALGAEQYRVSIYRVVKGVSEFVGHEEPAVLDESYIQENYGPGRYRLRILDSKGIYISGTTIVIGGRNPLLNAVKGIQDALPPADNGLRGQVDLLREQLNQQYNMILKLIEKNSEPAKQTSISEITAVLKDLHAMDKRPDPMQGMSSMLDVLKQGMELAQNTGDEKMSWVRVVESVLEKLPGVIGQMKQAGGHRIDEARERVLQQVQQNPLEALRRGIAYLKPKAAMRKDVGLWIDFILDNLEEPLWAKVASDILQVPFEKFWEIDPELGSEPFKSWFHALYEGLKDGLQNPGDTGGEAIDSGDASGNGTLDPSSGAASDGERESA